MTGPRLTRIAGALAEARPMADASLYELVRVGPAGLLGEVIRLRGDLATLQVYEETTGLTTGDPVRTTGGSLTLELGPGLLGAVLDGMGRPLAALAAQGGDLIGAGIEAATLEPARRWSFTPTMRPGIVCGEGDVLGEVAERPGFAHRILVPPGVAGTITDLRAGEYTVHDTIGTLSDGTPLRLAHAWPVRAPRPARERTSDLRPFITGQRVFDLLFPVAEGGVVALPGGFGTGKTVIEQSLAKHAEADIVVYIGCGERGNEMAELLAELPALIDPRTGRSIMDRTVMVVNTSNMPVAAREASVYVGVTIAEYFRDQGYRVAMLADSLSRWAEALREIGARLGEMPGEEGYPTYLGSRLAQFYERAGVVRACGLPERTGALTMITAISPPGGDFSEPVTQATLRVVGALWALDPALAHQRQFPAVDWETSWSLYATRTGTAFDAMVGEGWSALRDEVLALLQVGKERQDIADLVGPEALQDEDRLVLQLSRLLREVVLGQSAYDPADWSSPVLKTWRLARTTLALHHAAEGRLRAGRKLDQLDLAGVGRALAAARSVPATDFAATMTAVDGMIATLGEGAPR